jgi:hypothetical protein
MSATPCALCGSLENDRVIGAAGCVCLECLATATHAVIARQFKPEQPPRVKASERCVLCGESIVAGFVAATRSPYCLCAQCVRDALDAALAPRETFAEIRF